MAREKENEFARRCVARRVSSPVGKSIPSPPPPLSLSLSRVGQAKHSRDDCVADVVYTHKSVFTRKYFVYSLKGKNSRLLVKRFYTIINYCTL